MYVFQKITLAAILALGAAACGDDEAGDDDDDDVTGPDAAVQPTTRTLSLSFTNVPELGAGYVYEGWIIVDDAPVTTGRFTVDAGGDTDPATFELDADMVANAAKFVLTIEPATGDDPAPSAVHILAGPISGGSATLTTDDPAAIGTDFANAAGDYILATPTTGDDDTDDNQGIWWLVPGKTPAASLTLPALPEGWVYEGWVVGGNGPVSTGRFSMADEADSDGAGATAGKDGFPPFPGQDFIDPAVDLTTGHAAVISVEPDPDDDPGPFILKPLIDPTIEDVAAPTAQDMTNMAADSLSSGTATFN